MFLACYDIEDAEDETGKGGSEMTKFSISLPGIDQDISRLDDEIRKLQRLQQERAATYKTAYRRDLKGIWQMQN